MVVHKALILECLCDDDITIRSRAIELLCGMVTKRNLMEPVTQLLQHVTITEGKFVAVVCVL